MTRDLPHPNGFINSHRKKILTLIIIVAAFSRLSTIAAYYPYMNYMDEGHVLHVSLRMAKESSLDPKWYGYTPLVMELEFLAFEAYSPVYGLTHGVPFRQALAGAGEQEYYDTVSPPETMVIGRAITVLFSLGTIVLVYLAGATLLGAPSGLLAAFLLAFLPAHFIRSSVIITDMPMVFFATASFTALLFFYAKGRLRYALLAGAACGLAAASKHTGVLVILPLIFGVLIFKKRQGGIIRPILLISGGAALAFLAVCPFVIYKPTAFLKDFLWQIGFYGSKMPLTEMPSYLKDSLDPKEVGLPMLLLAAAGLIMGLLDKGLRKPCSFLAFLFFSWLGVMSLFKFQPFRNMAPLFPVLCLSAALGLTIFYRKMTSRSLAVFTVVVVVTGVTAGFAYADANYVYGMLKEDDPRVRLVDWINGGDTSKSYAIAEQIAVQPYEIARIKAQVSLFDVSDLRKVLDDKAYDYIVLPRFDARITGETMALDVLNRANYYEQTHKPVALFGKAEIPAPPGYWRYNSLAIHVIPLNR